jgi:CheY-like chemotaxis protein
MPFTFLVIDDDPLIGETAAELLALNGHRVFAALDGAAGLELTRSLTPDLILLDYNMPGMDGLAVLERLKAA